MTYLDVARSHAQLEQTLRRTRRKKGKRRFLIGARKGIGLAAGAGGKDRSLLLPSATEHCFRLFSFQLPLDGVLLSGVGMKSGQLHVMENPLPHFMGWKT